MIDALPKGDIGFFLWEKFLNFGDPKIVFLVDVVTVVVFLFLLGGWSLANEVAIDMDRD